MSTALEGMARRGFCLGVGAGAAGWAIAKLPQPETPTRTTNGRGERALARLPQDLAVRTLDGSAAVLPSVGAHLRVVNFWARWCAPCRRELPSLQRLADRLAERLAGRGSAVADGPRVAVQTVALDDDAFALREYWRSIGLARLGVWRLANQDLPASMMLTSLPHTFIVGRGGLVLDQVRGAREWDADEQVSRIASLARREAREA